MNRNRYIEPAEKLRLQKRFEALYVYDRLTVKEAARITGISHVTANNWIKEMGLKTKREAALAKARNGRDPDSANWWLVKIKRERPDLYPATLESFNYAFNSK